MAESIKRGIYKCEGCGIVLELLYSQNGEPKCCDKTMTKLEASSVDKGKEKHVPVIEEKDGKVLVKVGSVSHPMEEEHFIVFIEVLTDNQVLRREFDPKKDSLAIAEFPIKKEEVKEVREYCNVHGLWKA